MHLIIDGIKQLIKKANILEEKLLGIGIAVSGLIDENKGIVIRSSLLNWHNVDVRSEILSILFHEMGKSLIEKGVTVDQIKCLYFVDLDSEENKK